MSLENQVLFCTGSLGTTSLYTMCRYQAFHDTSPVGPPHASHTASSSPCAHCSVLQVVILVLSQNCTAPANVPFSPFWHFLSMSSLHCIFDKSYLSNKAVSSLPTQPLHHDPPSLCNPRNQKNKGSSTLCPSTLQSLVSCMLLSFTALIFTKKGKT